MRARRNTLSWAAGEHRRGVFDNALEGSNPRLALFLAAGLFGLVLFLLPLKLLLAVLLAALLLGLMFLALPFVLGLALGGFFFGFALGRGVTSQVRDGRLAPRRDVPRRADYAPGSFSRWQTVMLLPAPLPKTTIAAFVWVARWLGVHAVRRVEFAILVFLQCAGVLFFGAAPRRLDRDKMRPCGKFAVDVGGDFDLVARRVKALVALHVAKQAGVELALAICFQFPYLDNKLPLRIRKLNT